MVLRVSIVCPTPKQLTDSGIVTHINIAPSYKRKPFAALKPTRLDPTKRPDVPLFGNFLAGNIQVAAMPRDASLLSTPVVL